MSAPSVRRPIHPLVRPAFRLRLASFPMIALMLGSLLWERAASGALWVFLAGSARACGTVADDGATR